ncbi:thiamine-binding protein [Bifidobacterium callitrichos]|nr:thiamine-binding protein [Bifidobacterium callitrichos]
MTTGMPQDSTTPDNTLNTVSDRNAIRQEVPINPETGKPYLNTVAAIQVSVTGAGSEVSPYVAQAISVIRDSGLPQETNALFTDVEGDLDDILHVAGEAAKKLAEQGYRTSLVLHMDIRPGFTGQLTEKPKLADEIIARQRQ